MTSTQPHATDRPTREECLRAAGRVVLNIAIRIELDRLAALQAASTSQAAA